MPFSSNDIYNNDTYLEHNPGWGADLSKWKARLVTNLLKGFDIQPVSLAEVGCGAGGIVACVSEMMPRIEDLAGYDISSHAIALAEKHENAKLHFYNQDILDVNKTFDVVLCLDVIEHVDNVYGFLDRLKEKGKYKVFHIPLDISGRTILKPHVIKQQRDTVGHIHYFTKDTALWALEATGYEVLSVEYTKPVNDWQQSCGLKSFLKKHLRNLSYAISKELSVRLWGNYSILVLAT